MGDSIELFDKNGNPLSIEDIINEFTNKVIHIKSVNRVEVIDAKGRSYVNWNEKNKTKICFQDSGKTLKVFIS
jgi:hypothetical protein